MSPFFTIITSTYNAAATLPRLLDSLAAQTCRDFELIIQDGASRDDTLVVIESCREKIPHILLNSEPDNGIYDAWNKAVKRIQGEWVIFLGADDMLVNETTLENVQKALAAQSKTVLFGAGDIIMCEDGKELFVMPGLDKDVAGQLRAGQPAVHSGLFQRACLFVGVPFDISFKVVGDYDFVTRLWKKDADGVHLGIEVTKMAVGGATSNLYTMLRYRYEKIRVMRRYFGFSATLPHLPGLIKGGIPFALSRIFGPEKAVAIYNRLRTLRNLPPAHIK
ncbi:MAG: glycosyltransferase [Desulfovibrio sp.]|jgi:glycosyltransferase involved in cell wall biosynthesis|nr:glycosyltransferase [Desulfovibrio sp.]